MDGVQIDAPDAAERMDDHLDAADAAAHAAAAANLPEASALRVAALGARGLTAMATGDASAAADALDGVVAALRRDEDVASVRSAADGPHGAAVAAALKTAAHWIALTGVRVETGEETVTVTGGSEPTREPRRKGRATRDDPSDSRDEPSESEVARPSSAFDALDVADDLYARAADLASSSASSASPRAAHSALAADAVFADARLAQAQLALRRAVSASPDAATIRIADAEEAAASAVTAAESLGDPNHPRVALAVACSADVYVAKAVLAAKGGGGVGDGAGVMFAEGLYRNALRMLGTPRHPTATADDPDAAAGGAARSHLRLAAALAHARYAAVLRASGANRAGEADAWSSAALKEWDDDFSQTLSEDVVPPDGDESDRGSAAIRAAAGNIGSVGKTRAILDGQLMMPVVG